MCPPHSFNIIRFWLQNNFIQASKITIFFIIIFFYTGRNTYSGGKPLSKHHDNLEVKSSMHSRKRFQTLLINSIMWVLKAEQATWNPWKPESLAKALNSCSVLSFPPGLWANIIQSMWIVTFDERLGSGITGRIHSQTITFPLSGSAP